MNKSARSPDARSTLSSPFAKEIQFGLMYGMAVTTSSSLTELVAYPRSASRAKRRAAQGHRQHHAERPSRAIFKTTAGFLMHPAMLDEIKAVMAKKMDDLERRAFLSPARGQPVVHGLMTGRFTHTRATFDAFNERSPPPAFDMSKLRELLLKYAPPGSKELWP